VLIDIGEKSVACFSGGRKRDLLLKFFFLLFEFPLLAFLLREVVMIWTLLKLHQRTPEEEEEREEEVSLSSLFFQFLFSLCVYVEEREGERKR
jgi:hypothetical protein